MPSGSHGSFGGGHSGGGFSSGGFGGHSSGSHFGGSYYHGPRRPGRAPIHFHFFYFGGHRYAVANDDRSSILGLIFGAIMMLLASIVFSFTIVSAVNTVKIEEKMYVYYQDMIAYAEEHPEYMTEGKVQTYWPCSEDGDKWYIDYYFEISGGYVDGHTYSMYTYEQVKHFHSGDTIQLALDCPNTDMNSQTDSVNMDYKNFPLEDVEEYKMAKAAVATNIVIEIVIVGIEVFLIVFIIKIIKKNVQKVNENGQENDIPKFKYICTYCGSKLREEDASCPKCGSSTIETIVEKEQK